jgi:hypothetical protein
LICGLWARRTKCIIDVRITDVDAASNQSKDPQKVLTTQKKKKYLEVCLKQRHHFTTFMVSINGLLGREVNTLLKKLSSVLAEKWQKSFPEEEVCGYVNAHMSIAMVQATHLCLRGSHIPTS